MTEPSSAKLAGALEEAGYHDLAARARRDEFHDFASPEPLPLHHLLAELRKKGKRSDALCQRVIHGDFDATKAESEKWLASPEGQAAIRQLRQT